MPNASLLTGPIGPTLLRLAAPVLVVLTLQTLVGVAETYFVSFLGTAALAGVSLVFPLFMLMTMMSNGGIGGGVSSAVARAIGAGRVRDAQALAMHAALIGVLFGGIFSLGVWLGGPLLFARMGGQGDVLANAMLYANIVFAAAIPGWIANTVREPALDLGTAPKYSFETTETLLREFDTNVRAAREALAASKDGDYALPWSLKHGDRVIFTAPRGTVVRTHINHLIHHRGQLTVYLRLNDVPLPPIYGPTADEGRM